MIDSAVAGCCCCCCCCCLLLVAFCSRLLLLRLLPLLLLQRTTVCRSLTAASCCPRLLLPMQGHTALALATRAPATNKPKFFTWDVVERARKRNAQKPDTASTRHKTGVTPPTPRLPRPHRGRRAGPEFRTRRRFGLAIGYWLLKGPLPRKNRTSPRFHWFLHDKLALCELDLSHHCYG